MSDQDLLRRLSAIEHQLESYKAACVKAETRADQAEGEAKLLRAELEAVRRDKVDAERWRKHAEVMKASTLKDALHVSLRINKDGQDWGKEIVRSIAELGATNIDTRYVGMKVEQALVELNAAIAARAAAKGE